MQKKKLPEYQIIKKKLSDIKDNPDNPRVIEPESLEGLKASLNQFGLMEPIIWNKRTGHIVGGHQRKRALQEEGYEEAQVIVVDFPKEQEMMANISLNNPKIQGAFDERKTSQIIAELNQKFSEEQSKLLLTDLADSFQMEDGKERVKPEVEFTEELHEEHNYVVLYFKNQPDWLYLQSVFPLVSVKALDSKPGFEKQGVGRVVDGVKFLRHVLKH